MKKIFIFTLALPLIALADDPFPQGRVAAIGGSQGGPCDTETVTDRTTLAGARISSEGDKPLACAAVKRQGSDVNYFVRSKSTTGESSLLSTPGNTDSAKKKAGVKE